MIEINGNVGPYNSASAENYSRNAAYNVIFDEKKSNEKTSNVNSVDEIEFKNIKYSNLQGAPTSEYIKCAKAYSLEMINSLDKNNNGKVEKDEFIPQNTPVGMKTMLEKFFDVLDLNKDGAVDTSENIAFVLAIDSVIITDDLKTIKVEKPDGYIDGKNKMNMDKYILQFPDKAKELLKTIYNTIVEKAS